jgi:hypothetical protein
MEPTKEPTIIFQQLSLWNESSPNVRELGVQTQPKQVWTLLNLAQQQLLTRTLVMICYHLVKEKSRQSQTEEERDEQA